MTEAVEAQNIMLATLSGALVVLFGALYALLFALARLNRRKDLMWMAYAAYSLFFVATVVLAETLNLHGFWLYLVIILLLGYLLAPHGIWHLCVGTHGREEHSSHTSGQEGGTP